MPVLKRAMMLRQAAIVVKQLPCSCKKRLARRCLHRHPKIVVEAQKRYPHVAFRAADARHKKTVELVNEFASPTGDPVIS